MTASGHDFEELARMATSAEAADVRRAHELAVGGMRADARLGLVAATAYDRLRVFDGRPQKFGTHAIAERGDLVAWPVDPATTDTERAKWGVGTLQHLLQRAAAGPVVDKQLLRQAVRRRRASIADDARAAPRSPGVASAKTSRRDARASRRDGGRGGQTPDRVREAHLRVRHQGRNEARVVHSTLRSRALHARRVLSSRG